MPEIHLRSRLKFFTDTRYCLGLRSVTAGMLSNLERLDLIMLFVNTCVSECCWGLSKILVPGEVHVDAVKSIGTGDVIMVGTDYAAAAVLQVWVGGGMLDGVSECMSDGVLGGVLDSVSGAHLVSGLCFIIYC